MPRQILSQTMIGKRYLIRPVSWGKIVYSWLLDVAECVLEDLSSDRRYVKLSQKAVGREWRQWFRSDYIFFAEIKQEESNKPEIL